MSRYVDALAPGIRVLPRIQRIEVVAPAGTAGVPTWSVAPREVWPVRFGGAVGGMTPSATGWVAADALADRGVAGLGGGDLDADLLAGQGRREGEGGGGGSRHGAPSASHW